MGIFNSKLTNSSRITKWLLKMQPYRFKIEIIKGKDNVVADSLSRIPWPTVVKDAPEVAAITIEEIESDDELVLPAVDAEEDALQVPPKFDLKTIELAQANDENISRVIVAKQTDTPFDLEMELHITPFLRTLFQTLRPARVAWRSSGPERPGRGSSVSRGRPF